MSDLDLTGKAVVVSGGASGIGAACAEHAHSLGARVLALDRDEAGLARMQERLGITFGMCDVTDPVEIDASIRRCVDELGSLDGLVNAAGIFQTREMLDITVEEFDRMFSVNVRGVFFMQQAVARYMSTHGGGSIVNFASTAARIPRPVSSHYAASKAAVVSLSKSAAFAWGRYGIRVNAICPGTIETPMIERVRQERARLWGTTPEEIDASWREAHPMGRLGAPAEVAAVVGFLLADASSFVSGESIGVTGGSDYD
jgi:NAD(P)-dependent dehydrogenase (short-subunit alcohol dehydrogenase family)